jgi:hypothetical protein
MIPVNQTGIRKGGISMDTVPEELRFSIRKIGEEVKDFMTERSAYYGITRSGFLFNIMRTKTIQPHIEDENDYHSYMWIQCIDGYYLLRERFINGYGIGWYLEAEIIPGSRSSDFFIKMAGLFDESPELLNEICGPPHEEEKFEVMRVEL